VESTSVVVIDDIDKKSPADERRRFSVNGQEWQLDLTHEHAAQFDDALRPWIDHATAIRSARKHRRPGPRADEIRRWAKDNGYVLSTHGRIPAHVHEAYRSRNHNQQQRSA